MTKYCSFFVKGLSCPNDDCLYLHRLANENDCFNKEEGTPAKYVLKVGHNGIIEHIVSKNKEIWKIGNRSRVERDYNGTCFPGLNCAWRKIKNHCKEKGIAYEEKEKSKVVKTVAKVEKKVTPSIIKTSKWSHEEELPIFSRKNVFGEEEEEKEELALQKTTSVRQDYVSKNKEIISSKSNIGFTKKDKVKKKPYKQIFTPKGKSKPDLKGFSPKSEKNNKTSIHQKDKTDKTEETKQDTMDTQLTQQPSNTETDIVDEIEEVLFKNSSEYTELDKKIFSMLGQTFQRLKKEESEIIKRGQSLNPTKDRRTCCENIKNIMVDFLTPNEQLLSTERHEEKKKTAKETGFRLFGQSYTLRKTG